MRTTIDLDDDVSRALKRRQRAERKTLGQLASELLAQALAAAQPHVGVVGENDGFWPVCRRVSDAIKPKDNLVPDTHLVALMSQHGISTIWSHDQDFRKFDGLPVRDAFAS